MSLASITCQKSCESIEGVRFQSIWERVVRHWMTLVGDSPRLLLFLIQQDILFQQIGIQLDWFEMDTGSGIRVLGVQFNLPFNGVLSFFQEREIALTGERVYDWHEVSQDLYTAYRLELLQSSPVTPKLLNYKKRH